MKRSEFLAFIPALSAIPLIGKDIIKHKDKIEIFSPEEAKDLTDRPAYMPRHQDEIHIYRNGRLVALSPCYIEQINITSPLNNCTNMDMTIIIPGVGMEFVNHALEAYHSDTQHPCAKASQTPIR